MSVSSCTSRRGQGGPLRRHRISFPAGVYSMSQICEFWVVHVQWPRNLLENDLSCFWYLGTQYLQLRWGWRLARFIPQISRRQIHEIATGSSTHWNTKLEKTTRRNLNSCEFESLGRSNVKHFKFLDNRISVVKINYLKTVRANRLSLLMDLWQAYSQISAEKFVQIIW